MASLEQATLAWVTWFNHPRLLAPLGPIPPAEAENRYDQPLAVQAEHACAETTELLRKPGRFSDQVNRLVTGMCSPPFRCRFRPLAFDITCRLPFAMHPSNPAPTDTGGSAVAHVRPKNRLQIPE